MVKVSALQLVAMVAADQLVYRFASRALIAAIGQDRAGSATSVITVAEFDSAIASIESPSMDDHVKNAALFGADSEESYMRDAHASTVAAQVLADVRQIAACSPIADGIDIMGRTFTLKNLNAHVGDKVVILADRFQVMPWAGSIPIMGSLVNDGDFGFIPSGTYTIRTITGDEGFERHYQIIGPI